jgi:hypothetical protein
MFDGYLIAGHALEIRRRSPKRFRRTLPDLVSQLSAARTRRLVRLGLQQAGRAMGITEVVTASRSPWQNACVERVIGSIRLECLDHVVICNERHFAACSFVLRRLLPSNEDVSCTPQGLPGPSPHPATQDRKSRGHPAGRRSASSLRTARRLIRTSSR